MDFKFQSICLVLQYPDDKSAWAHSPKMDSFGDMDGSKSNMSGGLIMMRTPKRVDLEKFLFFDSVVKLC